MSKYSALQTFLISARDSSVPMTFAEIEKVIGAPLPASSRKHRAWWSNNPTNNVMTYAWLEAGFESADVDLASERLVFRRRTALRAAAPAGQAESADQHASAQSVVHPLFGALKGMISIEPGYDLTQPLIDPNWLPEPFDD